MPTLIEPTVPSAHSAQRRDTEPWASLIGVHSEVAASVAEFDLDDSTLWQHVDSGTRRWMTRDRPGDPTRPCAQPGTPLGSTVPDGLRPRTETAVRRPATGAPAMTPWILGQLVAERRAELMRPAEQRRLAAQAAHRPPSQPPRSRKVRWGWPHPRAARGSTDENPYHPAVPAARPRRA
jgi:hypothetical protein